MSSLFAALFWLNSAIVLLRSEANAKRRAKAKKAAEDARKAGKADAKALAAEDGEENLDELGASALMRMP